MRDRLRALITEHDDLAELDPAARRLRIRALLAEDGCENLAVTVAKLADLIDGAGPLTPLLRDDDVTDVLVNGPDEVWVERNGHLSLAGIRFEDEGALLEVIERLLGRAGARADTSRPIADARLQDGSRIHVVLPPVARRGPLVSIRRHRGDAASLDDLLMLGMLDASQRERLAALVDERASIVIGGATGSGKTTLLRALLGEIGEDQRIVIIEETPELEPACPHAVSLLTRHPNVEGSGAIGMSELIRAALRMRPDRIVVGEVRGAEAWAALGAMATGHRGSMVTVHADSAEGALGRLPRLAREDPTCDSEAQAGRLVHNVIDAVVQLEQHGSARRVVELMDREVHLR
jgi:pilus assembly protein CpaF